MHFSLDDKEILREIIMDNYQHPRNKKKVKDPKYSTVHMDSASCIDDIYIQVLIVEDKIQDCKWYGTGCAISLASTSIMSDLIKGKTTSEALDLIKEFDAMLMAEAYDKDMLGEANCFCNVNRQPSRITCANISWRGLKKILIGKKDEKKE